MGADFNCFWTNDRWKKVLIVHRFFINKFSSRDGWNQISSSFLHQFHNFRRHKSTMFDTVNSSKNCTLHSKWTMSMCSSYKSIIVSCCHYFFNFFDRELSTFSIFSNGKNTSRRSNFNYISSIFISLTNCFSSFFWTINNSFTWTRIAHQFFFHSISWIGMTTSSCNTSFCCINSWTTNKVFTNSISKRNIYTSSPQVSNSRKSCHQSSFTIHCSTQSYIGITNSKSFRISSWG